MTITLNQLIDQVREELLTPREANRPEAMYPFLFVEEVELQVGINISSSVEGNGRVTVHVVELGTSLDKSKEQTHHIKIKMTPLLTKDEVRERNVSIVLGHQNR